MKTEGIIIKPKKSKLYHLKLVIIFWLIYFFAAGILLFAKPRKVSDEYVANSSVADFYSDEIGPDRAVVMDDPFKSGLARLKIIGNAKESLNIAYYSIAPGESSDLFFGALLEAADRGVQVKLLLDGVLHGVRGNLRPIVYTFLLHPNMELKFYEPFNPLLPWTANNRMHDKYIIADNEIGIIGGRNIGDRYFAPDWHTENITHDRDVIIVNTKPGNPKSVIHKMTDYFEEIWHHKYSKSINRVILKVRRQMVKKKYEELREKFAVAKATYQEVLNQPVDFMKISFPTNKISFIHNPISRFPKEPWCWHEITQLIQSAQKSVFIQSPYVIPSRNMIKNYLDSKDFSDINISILTNSLASTPNPPAFAGYLNHRKKIVDMGINIFEYQSRDSLHAKAFVIDSDLFAIGTFNTDPRSTYLSTESMVIIHSSEGVKHLEEGLMGYMAESLTVDKNYGYSPSEDLEATPVKRSKILLLSFLSFWARLFEFML